MQTQQLNFFHKKAPENLNLISEAFLLSNIYISKFPKEFSMFQYAEICAIR